MTLHTYTPQPMSLPSMNFLHLTVSEIQPGQTISRRPPAHPDTMGENNTPTALKGCGVIKCIHVWPKNIYMYTFFQLISYEACTQKKNENSIRDARTPQPREIFSTP